MNSYTKPDLPMNNITVTLSITKKKNCLLFQYSYLQNSFLMEGSRIWPANNPEERKVGTCDCVWIGGFTATQMRVGWSQLKDSIVEYAMAKCTLGSDSGYRAGGLAQK